MKTRENMIAICLYITDHVGDLIQSAEFIEADRQSLEVNQGLDRLQFADSIVVEI